MDAQHSGINLEHAESSEEILKSVEKAEKQSEHINENDWKITHQIRIKQSFEISKTRDTVNFFKKWPSYKQEKLFVCL